VVFADGIASPEVADGTLRTKMHRFDSKQSAATVRISQSPIWQNWSPIKNLGPSNLGDAPVMLSMGPDNYWMFSRDMINWVHSGSVTERHSP